jgi:hypothetical protein
MNYIQISEIKPDMSKRPGKKPSETVSLHFDLNIPVQNNKLPQVSP